MINYTLVIILIVFIFMASKLKAYFYPALFFLFRMIGNFFLDFERIRFNVAYQLVLIAILFLLALRKSGYKIKRNERILYAMAAFILSFSLIYVAVGLINGFSLTQALIDSYKYLDIVALAVLFRISWKNNEKLFKGLKAMLPVMFLCGIIELFTTTRGGIGLNMIVSFFPMILILMQYGKVKNKFILLLISFVIVSMCKTRTYIAGYLIEFFILMFYIPRGQRKALLGKTSVLGIIGAILIGFFGGGFLEETISRFMELKEGFEYSGGYRIYDYMEALRVFGENPVMGTGFGYLKWTYINKMGWMDWGDFVHCFYLEALFKTGIIGMLLLVAGTGYLAHVVFGKIQKYRKNSIFVYAVTVGAMCSFVCWLFIYTLSPLTTLGSVFSGLLVAVIAQNNYRDELKGEC